SLQRRLSRHKELLATLLKETILDTVQGKLNCVIWDLIRQVNLTIWVSAGKHKDLIYGSVIYI
ncbi:hypothetical protein BXQ27_33215, partial [Klebsiella aerogenes]